MDGSSTSGARARARSSKDSLNVVAQRVLLAWELGLGFGHTTKLARLGTRLRAAGHEVVAAAYQGELCAPLRKAGIKVLPGPPLAPIPHALYPASTTLTDSLAQGGLMDEERVRAAIARWRQIMDAFRPDLVVADYAPLAAIAARGRAPILQEGAAFCLPPSRLDAFPPLHDFGPAATRDADLLALINRALAALDMPEVPRIGALFAGDDVFVTTFQLLDPYADLREGAADGPLIDEPIPEVHDDASGIFGYFHQDVALRPDVLAALCALGPRLELYLTGGPAAAAAPLLAAGVTLHAEPQRLSAVLPRKRLVLHQGSAGIAADALLAGVPQYVLCQHVEHYLNAEALQAAGVARSRRLFDPNHRVEASDILAFAADADAAFVARAAGRMHREILEARNPMDDLVKRCLALMA